MSFTDPESAVNRLVAVGKIDISAEQTTIELESGRVVAVPTALLLEQTMATPSLSIESSSPQETPVVIPVIAEKLVITKRLVPLETVRITKSSESRIERVKVPLLKERWEISRVPIDAEVAERSDMRYEADVAIYPLYEERVMTRTAIFLREELHVRKVTETIEQSVEIELTQDTVSIERSIPNTRSLSRGDATVLGFRTEAL